MDGKRGTDGAETIIRTWEVVVATGDAFGDALAPAIERIGALIDEVVLVSVGTTAYRLGNGWAVWHAGRWEPVVRQKGGRWRWAALSGRR